jgi:penicillin amidase
MKIYYLAHLAVALCIACGKQPSNTDAGDRVPDAASTPLPGPYDAVDLAKELRFDGLDGPVHAVRDRYGIVHIHAQSISDLAFAQGYVTAHDRLPQLEIMRRTAAGTLSELFGGLNPSVITSDLEMRMNRLRPFAEASYAEFQNSTDPLDAEIVLFLDRFADGVNAFTAAVASGAQPINPQAGAFLPAQIAPWTAVDSLMIGRLQALALSFNAPGEIAITQLYQSAVSVFDLAPALGDPAFDPARDARRGASRDLFRITPLGKIPVVENSAVDHRLSARKPASARPATPRLAHRPQVPPSLLDNANRLFNHEYKFGLPTFRQLGVGSNGWAVAPAHGGGKPLLANDPHLPFSNPSIFYPMHLVLPGELDVQGVAFPGLPGLILGHNGHVAWGATNVTHDACDVYLESMASCASGNGDCVQFQGSEVAIETWKEEFRVGIFGAIGETFEATYELVPHHGPVIPTIENNRIVERSGNTALSVRYTGYAATYEFRAIYGLLRASSVADAMSRLDDLDFGAMNWMIIDTSGSIGWSTTAAVPLRSAGTYTWNPVSNPAGAAPFFILSGDGSFEWEEYIDRSLLPQAVNPAQGYLVTANADPMGNTFDGILFNDGSIAERPLYLAARYALGLRAARITQLIQEYIAASKTMDLEDMAAIQHDTHSNFGERMRPHLVAALAKIDDASGRTQDVTDWLASTDAAVLDRMRQSATYLADWTLATPAAIGTPTDAERRDSVATTLFTVWMHYFFERTFGDEYQAMGMSRDQTSNFDTLSLLPVLFEDIESLGSGVASETGQPVLCDDMQTANVIESCDLMALQSMMDALAWLASSEGFATEAMDTWVWGQLHTLTIEPLFPNPALNLPPPNVGGPSSGSGYPVAGDNDTVTSANSGYNDLDFRQADFNQAMRFLAAPSADGLIRAHLALPGGVIYDPDSPHYKDLLENYFLADKHFEVPYTTTEIVGAGEERWLFRP